MSDPVQTREWNAAAYHSLSGPQLNWGRKVLSTLDLRGDEFLMDAGCGTGRLTAELLEALPHGRVLAVDVSLNMLIAARTHLNPQSAARIHFVAADLQHLPLQHVFDGIFSTAAFHWVPDHPRLFQNLHRALRPGGWLRAQCGGGPNLARLRKRMDELIASPKYAEFFTHFRYPWVFNGPETAASLLQQAGFVEVETSLESALTVIENREKYEEFVRTAILRLHIEQIPCEWRRNEFVGELVWQAAADDPPFSLDYWRLNLSGKAKER